MKRKLLVILLSLLLCLAFALASCESSKKGSGEDSEDDSNGKKYTMVDRDTILFGSYPQSTVTDEELISTLNTKAGELPTSSNVHNWTDYGYYVDYEQKSFMWYVDVENDGEKYRGVYFTEYRSYDSCQEENGYTAENVYWFKYEPLSWSIIDENGGVSLVVCDMVIDCQPFDNLCSNNYAESFVRAWLNEAFYDTAFSDSQKEIIVPTMVDNSPQSADCESNIYACENTEDNIFLLSHKEVKELMTELEQRKRKTTDYANLQGAKMYESTGNEGNAAWWLRSPHHASEYYVKEVGHDGYVINMFYVTDIRVGIVPALNVLIN